MSHYDLKPGLSALTDFRRTWPQLFLVSLATRVAVTLFLLPGLALVLRLALSRQGRAALSDEEIVFFFLSPVGIVTLVVVGGAWIGIALIEQAGLMTIGFGAAENRRITWYMALRYVVGKSVDILLLGGHLLVRAVALAMPLLLLVGGVYWVFLREHDINYYLSNRPPDFMWAAGIAGVLIAAFAVLFAIRVLGWMYSLPAVLFEGLGPHAALKDSIGDSKGRRWKLFWWIAAWFVVGWLVSAALTWIIGFTGRLIVPQASESVRLVAFTIGTVGLLSIAANVLISFVSGSLFALLVVRLYRDDSGPGALSRSLAEEGSLGETAYMRVPRKGILLGGAAALAAAALVAVGLVSQMRLEDDTIVIAHRGAALHAPENTMASVNRAIEAATDFIEIDVQETADGDVVVFHDSDFMKTAGSPLKLWDARRSDLETLDIGSWFDPAFADERTPTLEEVLVAARGRSKVNIELKYYGHDVDLERKVIDIVERTGMAPNIVVMSLKYDKVQKVRSMRPDWTYGLLTSVNLGDPTSFDVDFLAIGAASASRRFVRRAHSADRVVYVWTVNDPFTMSAMMSRGVDGIITDDPALARQVLELRSQLNPVERLLVGIGTEVGVFSMPERMPDEADA